MTPARARERARIERLWWRAGFGPRRADLDRLAPRGLDAAVDELLAPPRGPELEPGRGATVDGQPIDPENAYGHDVLWWLDRAVRARHPLVERMTLNWHDHFATSNEKVGSVKLMMAQYRTLRRHALGRFRDLAVAMVNDHAMQRWLDLVDSTREAPNENFARELFELFTLGVNNGYTERDIREAARAFTGFRFDWDKRRFWFDADQHDTGVKTVLGRRGSFTPRDVVQLAVDHPAHAPYLCRKLWGYFTPQPCPAGTLRDMVRAYRSAGTQVRPVLAIILRHRALYADLAEGDQVKPPLVYVAGMLRRTGRRVDGDHWVWLLDQMGQRPFSPPNVAGWDQDLAWLSTGTIRSRFQAVSHLVDDWVEDGSVAGTQTPAQAIDAAIRATGTTHVGPRTRDALWRYARASVAGRTERWEVRHYYAERQRVLRHLLLAGPEAQVS
ncbi:MAG: DUF1800 domain-containing protein [Actinomycetota bacterium]